MAKAFSGDVPSLSLACQLASQGVTPKGSKGATRDAVKSVLVTSVHVALSIARMLMMCRRKSWPLRDRSTRLLGMTLSACSSLALRLKEVEVVTGIWVHTVQWNRALTTCFEGTFASIMGDAAKNQRWGQAANGYFQLVALLPLLYHYRDGRG